jgi:chemotaxis response regulator CheB
MFMPREHTRALIVDDSSPARQMLKNLFDSELRIEVIGGLQRHADAERIRAFSEYT